MYFFTPNLKTWLRAWTDHYPLVWSFRVEKPTVYTNVQDQEILPNKVGGPGGQKCKKGLCTQCIILIPKASGMHSGRRDGLAAIASSAVWI